MLNFSMFLATVVGSALTMTLVGNLKTVLVLGLGFFLLGGAQLTLLMALGARGRRRKVGGWERSRGSQP